MTKRVRHPKPTKAQIAGRALRKTAEVVEDRGWIAGAYGMRETGFCALGGIRYTQGVAPLNEVNPAANAATEEFAKWLKENGYVESLGPDLSVYSSRAVVMAWNDRLAGDKEQFLSVLRKAADDLDPQR